MAVGDFERYYSLNPMKSQAVPRGLAGGPEGGRLISRLAE
jgi:hypothetical protein